MDIYDFEDEMSSTIFGRGKSYFDCGYVESLEKKSKTDKWVAIVAGSADYKVSVELDENEIIDSECSCPYDHGPICKHEVAVYLAIAEKLNDDTESKTPQPAKKKKKKNNINDILVGLNKDTLIKIIKKHADFDEIFELELINKYAIIEITKSEYENTVNSGIYNAMNDDDFVSWRNASAACSGAELVIENAQRDFDDGEIQQALYGAQAVIEVMIPALQSIDDSGGEPGMCIDDAFEILHKAAKKKLDKDVRKEFFEYLIDEWKEDRYEGWGWKHELLDMAIDAHFGKEEAEIVMQSVNQCFKEAVKNQKDMSWSDSKPYELKYKTLLKLKRKKEAEKFLQDNLSIPEFRRIALEKAWNKKKYSTTLSLADDGLKNDKNFRGLVKEWKEWKMKVFQARGDKEDIKELSLDFFLNGEFEYYNLYKKSFSSNEWNVVCKNLIEKLSIKLENSQGDSATLAFILSEENKLKELLELVKIKPRNLRDYENVLLSKFPEDIFKINAKVIREEINLLRDRKDYSRLCRFSLAHLNEIGGGNQVKEIIRELREKYPRKSALLDELLKFENSIK